jgi:hypothetical protein
MRLSDLQPRIVQTGHIARRPDAAKILSAHHLIRKVLQLSGMMRFRPSTYPKSLATFWVDGVNPSAYPKSRVAGRPCNFSD